MEGRTTTTRVGRGRDGFAGNNGTGGEIQGREKGAACGKGDGNVLQLVGRGGGRL